MPRAQTTITLTPDAQDLVLRAMAERGVDFTTAVDDAIVQGLRPVAADRSELSNLDLGPARMPLDRALALGSEMEDEELLRRREPGE